MQLVGRSHEIVAGREVGGVDDQRLPFPSSARVTFPQADGRRKVRAAVQADDPRFVHRLEEQHDVRRRLDDLVEAKGSGAGIGAAQPRHPVGQAPFDMGEIFRPLEWPPANRVGRQLSPLRFGGQRRDPAIRRIDDQRGAIVELALDHLVGAAGRGRARELGDIRQRGEIDGISTGEVGIGVLEQTIGALAQLGDFLVGQRRPPLECFRALEGGRAVVQPDALQIRMAIRAERNRRRIDGTHLRRRFGKRGRLRRDRRRGRDNGREGRRPCEQSTVHFPLRSRDRRSPESERHTKQLPEAYGVAAYVVLNWRAT